MTEQNREQAYRQIIEELFQIIEPATLNIAAWPQVDALKRRYQELRDGLWYQSDWTAEPSMDEGDDPVDRQLAADFANDPSGAQVDALKRRY